MLRPFQIAAVATLMTTLSLYLWRISYILSDWAILALMPMAAVIAISYWSFSLDPWKAHLDMALRDDSSWERWVSGRIRATLLSTAFTLGSVTLLAWQAFRASVSEAIAMLFFFFISALAYSFTQKFLLQHFRQPFARSFTTSLVTWCVAVPASIAIAMTAWSFTAMPGKMLSADFQEAVQIGLAQLPPRRGWISTIFMIPFGYEAVKIWIVVQLREYPVFGWLFSIDSALFSFILCRTSIIIAQFSEANVLPKLRT